MDTSDSALKTHVIIDPYFKNLPALSIVLPGGLARQQRTQVGDWGHRRCLRLRLSRQYTGAR